MKLTPSQIQYIQGFVKRKYVDFYDVQIELVDHIATAIEEKMELDSKLDFYTALQQVYEGFGRFGFTDFVAEKEKQVQRRFRKMHAHEWQKFFTVPKVILTLILILLSSLTCLLPETNFLKYSFATIYILSLIVQFVFMFREQKRQREKLISWNTPFKISNLFVLIMQFTALGFYEEISNAYPFVAATIIVLAIVSYFAEINAMIKISSEQRRLYPEAFAME